MKQLKLLDFIKNNSNWEELLQKEPYYLKIKRDRKFIIFNYNQIMSDFSNPIVKEARGIILEDKTFRVVCFPFTKFFNVDEPNASKIDWESARVQEKIDGSLIKVWFDNDYGWQISTNGCIDAFTCELPNNLVYNNFGELFLKAIDGYFEGNPNYTYMFELVSPYNKIVVDYPEIKVYHLATRDNITGEEVEINLGIDKPKQYKLKTEEDVKRAASRLPFDEEGYVVVDKYYNRVKIKSPAYVNAHRLVNNHVINRERALGLIIQNEQEEFLSYFPEYTKEFNKINDWYSVWKNYLKLIEYFVKEVKDKLDRKEFALIVQEIFSFDTAFAFQLYNGIVNNSEEYISKLTIKKIIERIEKYD